MDKIKELLKNIEEGKFTPLEIVLSGLVLLLSGMILGMFLSPRKSTVLGSYNESNIYTKEEKCD